MVDAVGSGRKQLYQGKEYDYVFDVDIQDGVPPLKLPYNVSGSFHFGSHHWTPWAHRLDIENPYGAAQRFLQSNELPLTYVDEVVKFIEKNTAGVNIGTGGEDYVDPYTGKHKQTFRSIYVHDKIHLIRRIEVSQLSWLSSWKCSIAVCRPFHGWV